MDFTAFNERMICDDDIRPYKVDDIDLGYDFYLRYPTYRGAYVCNIEQLDVTVDGKKIDKKNMRFGVNGKWFLMSQIPDLCYEYWFTGTKAILRVLDENGISDGKHKVDVYLKHKIPYTGYFGNYLIIDSNCTKTLNTSKGDCK